MRGWGRGRGFWGSDQWLVVSGVDGLEGLNIGV